MMKGSIAKTGDLVISSKNIQVYTKDRIFLLRFLITINLIFGGWYLFWRANSSINVQAFWISIPLFLAELYVYLGGILFFSGLWRPIARQVRSLRAMKPAIPESDLPTVDVFITCCNEPVELIAQTARAALAIDYPVTKLCVYILDDGNAAEVRQMSEQLCVEDLQTPLLVEAAERINADRLRLQTALQELELLAPEIPQVERRLQTFYLQTKTNYEALADVLTWFEALRPEFVPQSVWIELQTVLGEGFDNAVCHAHRHLPQETPIEIRATLYTRSVQIEIFDQGPDFDFESRVLNLADQIDDDAERGRGLHIFQQIADYISYVRMPDRRNRLLLTKLYAPAPVDNADSPALLTSYLQSCQRLLLLGNPTHMQVSDYLKAEYERCCAQLHQKELELSGLSRCRYIARPKPVGKPHHAKAGNINYALFSGEAVGELILTLDADHIPKPQFLQRVIPYFFTFDVNTGRYRSNQTAFVQTPQAFYNLPPNDPFGHQAHLFYGIIQQSKDGMNSAFYTGTNAILRREALITVGLQNFSDEYLKDEDKLDEFELVSGISSASVTEDMNTAMRLHAAGWQSAYHHEVLAEGLAPDDLQATLKQKLRWAQGTIQVFLKENPLLKPGLSIAQRLQYFQTMYSYFSGFFTIIFIACPILFFFTDILPIKSSGFDFLIHFVPAFALNRLTIMMVGQGIPFRELWRSEQYAIALFPLYIQAVWSVVTGRSIKFHVTPKQRQSGRYLNLIVPQLAIVGLTGLGMLWCLYRFVRGELSNPWLYGLNSAWALYNVALVSVVIRAAVWQPSKVQQ
jgi:cellulose synthase (UDP-forming)